MRKDMSRIIVERPRTGSGWRRTGRTEALVDDDGTPLRQRAPRRKSQRTKSLNENLAPLRRFLESNVGRPWAKVHSEIAENIRPTSTVQKHVLDHVSDFVAINTTMKDGKVMVFPRFGRGAVAVEKSFAFLYVHPKTGLLKKNRHWRGPLADPRKKRSPPRERRRDIGPMRQAHLFRDGAWWDVVLERIPQRVQQKILNGRLVKHKVPLDVTDEVLSRGLSDLPPGSLYGRDGVYAVSVRRLTKAERKRLDLP
jgi:hypothetical protein